MNLTVDVNVNAKELSNAILAMAMAISGIPSNEEISVAVEKVKKATKVQAREEPKAETKIKGAEVKAQAKETKTKEDKSVKETETKEVAVTIVEVRAKFVELAKKGKREELKAMLDDFKVAKVSDLEPEHFLDVMAKLEAM